MGDNDNLQIIVNLNLFQVLKELEIAQAKDSEMIPIAIGTE